MSFLPNDYDLPEKPGHYMKLKDGENRFRILSRTPLLGWLDWTKEKKPIRFAMDAPPEAPINPARPIKHFWAMLVWNYATRSIQIIEITQSSIQKKLKALATDIDWGDPREYDIKIVRSGSGMETEYAVTPGKPTPITEEILEHARATKVDITELLTGADPFASASTTAYTWWQELANMPAAPLSAAVMEAPARMNADGFDRQFDDVPPPTDDDAF